MKRLLKARFVFPAIFIFSLSVFLAHISYTKTALYSDSRFYYSYTLSWVKDHDIKLNSELLAITGNDPSTNKKGLAVNTFSPGTSIFWVPSFWLADSFVKSVNLFGNLLDQSGLSVVYQTPPAVTSILLLTLGLYLVYRTLLDFFSVKNSLLTSISLLTTTNLLFYAAVEPLMSHAISFFISALFLFYFTKYKGRRNSYFVLGFLAGVAGLVRILNSFLILIPAIKVLRLEKRNLIDKLKLEGKLALGYLIGFFPQIYICNLFFNEFIIGPSWGYGFDFRNPHIIHVLFNTQNGLFTLTPIVFVAISGMIFFWKRNKELAFFGLSYFILHLFLVSSWAVFTQGGSYSIRMLITTYPLLAFGLAEIIKQYKGLVGENTTVITIFGLSFLNVALMTRYLLLY
jgi:hypothetical protein